MQQTFSPSTAAHPAALQSPEYIIVTSDPQYPDTLASLIAQKKHERAEGTDASLSQAWTAEDQVMLNDYRLGKFEDKPFDAQQDIINEQYRAINAFRAKHPGKTIPIMINGDITAFGHGSERKFMYSAINGLGSHVYLGLGNHDYANNVNDCAQNGCAIDSISDFLSYMEGHYPNLNVDYTKSQSGLNKTWSGSFSYSRSVGALQIIQLNLHPLYAISFKGDTGNTKRFEIKNSLAWLESELKKAIATRKIVIINIHSPANNSSKGEPPENSKWTSPQLGEMLRFYKPAMIFCGHTHTLGRISNATDSFSDIPGYNSGATARKNGLTVEYSVVDQKIRVTEIRDNNFATTAPHTAEFDMPPPPPSSASGNYDNTTKKGTVKWSASNIAGAKYIVTKYQSRFDYNEFKEVKTFETGATEYIDPDVFPTYEYEYRIQVKTSRTSNFVTAKVTPPYFNPAPAPIWTSAEQYTWEGEQVVECKWHRQGALRAQVFLNGKQLLGKPRYPADGLFADDADVWLEPGKNTLILKGVANGGLTPASEAKVFNV